MPPDAESSHRPQPAPGGDAATTDPATISPGLGSTGNADPDSRPRQPAVFLDRDDTLMYCNAVTPDGDLGDPSLVELMPGVYQALRDLRRQGFLLFCVSNQAGVARGRYGEDDVRRVNQRLNAALDGMIGAFRFCPHHPEAVVKAYQHPDHPSRKPRPGMILDLADEHNVDLAGSWMIGDKPRDCAAGQSAGCRSVLLCGEHGETAEGWHMARDMTDATELIIRESRLRAAQRTRSTIAADKARLAEAMEQRRLADADAADRDRG